LSLYPKTKSAIRKSHQPPFGQLESLGHALPVGGIKNVIDLPRAKS
jgi:hypothetical protein